jgi:hypothetical protein
MRKFFSLVCLSVSFYDLTTAQVFTDSNLPIFVISTDQGVPIPDNPRVKATMKIIYKGPGNRNYMTDQNYPDYLNYNGRIDIEIRGSSSQTTEKKQYGFTTRKADNSTNNVSLLGMPPENDWILNSMTFDPSLIRDYLNYNLSRQIGEYASRTAYCEVVINNEYKGLYLLQEKIKPDKNRVDILKIGMTDNLSPEVTGGYIIKADKDTGGDPVLWSEPSGLQWISYIHDWPKPELATVAQTDYIHNQFQLLATSSSLNNSSVSDGFPSVIDIPSFIDHMIISELGSNVDSYMYSAYFHKDRNDKLRAGPIWDNDLTFGNDLFFWGYNRSKTDVWQFSNGDNEGSRFWKDLFNNAIFRCYLSRRWNELIMPGQPLNPASIEFLIDKTLADISEAVLRNNNLWGYDGNWQDKISAIKTFIGTRIDWMTANLGSYAECSKVQLPLLVISKIMYHPSPEPYFLKADDREFIEITNNGDQTVNLSGVYFGGTGLVYQFPVNSTIGPHASVILASNIPVFKALYNIVPFGQFTRNLSNKGQNLILMDGYGNMIDNVSYSDTIPWPNADGNGNYLKLTDPNLDNDIPANWTASSDIILSDLNITADPDLQVFPNPVKGILTIQNGKEIKSISLIDISGRILLTLKVNSNELSLDMSHFTRGIYFIRVATSYRTYMMKVVNE